MSNLNELKQKYLYNMDFLRFLLVMIIVYGHCIGIIPPVTPHDIHVTEVLRQTSSMSSQVALCSFFTISGYFLYNSFLRNPGLETKEFAYKRILRLWPLLLFSFVVLLIFGRFNRMCILNIFFINSGLGLLSEGSNNPASWFICVLLVLSIFFYYILKNFGERNTAFLCAVTSFWGYAVLNNTFSTDLLYCDIIPGFSFLTFGMLLGISNISLGILFGILSKDLPDLNLRPFGKIICTILEASIFFYIIYATLISSDKITILTYWEFYFIILFILFILNQGYFSKILNCRFSKVLGSCSYAIFIMQFPTIRILSKYFKDILSPAGSYTNTVISVTACFVIGILTHILVEKNINKLIDKHRRKA